jgi:hypothetical protein
MRDDYRCELSLVSVIVTEGERGGGEERRRGGEGKKERGNGDRMERYNMQDRTQCAIRKRSAQRWHQQRKVASPITLHSFSSLRVFLPTPVQCKPFILTRKTRMKRNLARRLHVLLSRVLRTLPLHSP